MQSETEIPCYLSDDFSMYLENMESLSDPENPDLLTNYLKSLSAQLALNNSHGRPIGHGNYTQRKN
jgi:hypothetical protein